AHEVADEQRNIDVADEGCTALIYGNDSGQGSGINRQEKMDALPPFCPTQLDDSQFAECGFSRIAGAFHRHSSHRVGVQVEAEGIQIAVMRGGESDRGVGSAVTRRPDVKAAVSFRTHRANIGVKIGEAYLLSETDAENAWVADFEP